jgi:multimeric flavodoxin WrbA
MMDSSTLMEPTREPLKSVRVKSGDAEYLLTLIREDFSDLYPRMMRYILTVREGDNIRAVFRTNSFEYSPLNPLVAENVAREKAAAWENDLTTDSSGIFQNYPVEPERIPERLRADLVIIQGSPRPDGNCGILVSWAVEGANDAGCSSRVIYPYDLDIHCCIGCYQCYNTGTCVFDDDMTGIIDAVRDARLLIICSPVYTNTVPAGLKLVIDRMQAYHAERTLQGNPGRKKGILFSVAGRKGENNFTCITKVILPFFTNIGIESAGQVLIDSTDAVKDIRAIPGRKEEVIRLVAASLPR